MVLWHDLKGCQYLIATFGINHRSACDPLPPVRSLAVGPPIRAKGLAQLCGSVKLKASFYVKGIHESGETLSWFCA
jgi:hypothetical protein